MTEAPTKEIRRDQVQLEFKESFESQTEEKFYYANSMIFAQFRYSLPYVLAAQEGMIEDVNILSNAKIPSFQSEFHRLYGPHYKLAWLNGKKVIEIAGGSRSKIDASNSPYSADPIGPRMAATNLAEVVNIDIGEPYPEDINLYRHIQADVCEYLFGNREHISEEIKEIWDSKQDVLMMNGVIYYKNPSKEFLIAASTYFPDLPLFDESNFDKLQEEMEIFKNIHWNNTLPALNKLEANTEFKIIYAYKQLRDRIIEKVFEKAEQVLNEDGVINIEGQITGIKKNGKMHIFSTV